MDLSTLEWESLFSSSSLFHVSKAKPRVITPLPALRHPLDDTDDSASHLRELLPLSSSQDSLPSSLSLEEESDTAYNGIGASSSCRNQLKVIVHKISRNETLPGIALLYGIPIYDLKVFNQLWDLNSIHSKNILLIPFEHCTPSQAYQRLRSKGYPWNIICVCSKMLPNRITLGQLNECYCSRSRASSSSHDELTSFQDFGMDLDFMPIVSFKDPFRYRTLSSLKKRILRSRRLSETNRPLELSFVKSRPL